MLRGADSPASDAAAHPDALPPLPKFRVGNLRVGPLGLLIGVLLIIVVGSGVRYGGAASAPKLAASCRTPALALSATAVAPGGAVHYTAVGPRDLAVVLALDASLLRPDLTATAQPEAQQTQVIRERKQLRGCRTTGVLGVQLPPGRHTVGLFPAAGGGPLATTTLTVTAR